MIQYKDKTTTNRQNHFSNKKLIWHLLLFLSEPLYLLSKGKKIKLDKDANLKQEVDTDNDMPTNNKVGHLEKEMEGMKLM